MNKQLSQRQNILNTTIKAQTMVIKPQKMKKLLAITLKVTKQFLVTQQNKYKKMLKI